MQSCSSLVQSVETSLTLATLNSFQPPITVGMITTSTSKNMDMISRVAEKGRDVSSSGMYGVTKNEANMVAH